MQNSDSDSGESTKTVALSPKQENSLTMGPKIPLPVLSEGNIEAFFYSIEFWFEASGITSDTKKFNIICATLPPNKLMEMKTIIDAVPSAKKYDYIKVKLIEHYADSEQKRVRRVLSDMPLGDRKPSELYNEMKRVAGKSLGDSILLDLWITRLPSHVQPAIIASKVAIEEKLKIADSITESMTLQRGSISEASSNSEISNLKNQVNQLSRDMQKLLQKKHRGSRSRSHSRSRMRSKSRAGNKSDSSATTCWYHTTFREKATKCRQPCNFSPKSQ